MTCRASIPRPMVHDAGASSGLPLCARCGKFTVATAEMREEINLIASETSGILDYVCACVCNKRAPLNGPCCCDEPNGHEGDCGCRGYTAGVGVATTELTATHAPHRWWRRAAQGG